MARATKSIAELSSQEEKAIMGHSLISVGKSQQRSHRTNLFFFFYEPNLLNKPTLFIAKNILLDALIPYCGY